VIIFSNCKINLGLRVVRKRNDGYHDLETVFYPVPFHDVIEAIRTENGMEFTTSGNVIDGKPEQNLCMKAFDLLNRSHNIPPIQLHLHKNIPAGAGLGGGSANGAMTLRLLNNKLNLGLSTDQLLDLSLQLGSDCPFFIINKPCFATGRGEIFESVDLSHVKKYKLVLVNPGIHVSTALAFSKVKPAVPVRSAREIVMQPVATWKDELVNDFEEAVFAEHPAIGQIKQSMYDAGAVYASMSGSGSTVFGLFEEEVNVKFGDGLFVRWFDLDDAA